MRRGIEDHLIWEEGRKRLYGSFHRNMLIITLSVDLLSLVIKTKTEGLINHKEVQISTPDEEVFPRQGVLLKPQNFG